MDDHRFDHCYFGTVNKFLSVHVPIDWGRWSSEATFCFRWSTSSILCWRAPQIDYFTGFRLGELGGQYGSSVKAWTPVYKNATVCFDLWNELVHHPAGTWNCCLTVDEYLVISYFSELDYSSMYCLLWFSTKTRVFFNKWSSTVKGAVFIV